MCGMLICAVYLVCLELCLQLLIHRATSLYPHKNALEPSNQATHQLNKPSPIYAPIPQQTQEVSVILWPCYMVQETHTGESKSYLLGNKAGCHDFQEVPWTPECHSDARESCVLVGGG